MFDRKSDNRRYLVALVAALAASLTAVLGTLAQALHGMQGFV